MLFVKQSDLRQLSDTIYVLMKSLSITVPRGGHCQHCRERNTLNDHTRYVEKSYQPHIEEGGKENKETKSNFDCRKLRNLHNKENSRAQKVQQTIGAWGKNYKSLGSLAQVLINPVIPQPTCKI